MNASSNQRSVKHLRTRVRRASALGLACLCCSIAARANALDIEEIVGFWEGRAKGGTLEEPIPMILELWVEDGELTGIIACEYGVSVFDKCSLRDDIFRATFFFPNLGAGAVRGTISPSKVCEYQWMFSDARGTGSMRWIDAATLPDLSPAQVAGRYRGMAQGLLTGEMQEVGLNIHLEDGAITGSIDTPDGEYPITKGRIRRNRVLLEIQFEDRLCRAYGVHDDGTIRLFWDVGEEAGKALVRREP